MTLWLFGAMAMLPWVKVGSAKTATGAPPAPTVKLAIAVPQLPTDDFAYSLTAQKLLLFGSRLMPLRSPSRPSPRLKLPVPADTSTGVSIVLAGVVAVRAVTYIDRYWVGVTVPDDMYVMPMVVPSRAMSIEG